MTDTPTDGLEYEAIDLSGLTDEQRQVFEKLTKPFRRDEIELLPKPWAKEGKPVDCTTCGGRHLQGAAAPHLSYVGHAGVTTRLLEVDPTWSWEPLHPDIDDRALAAVLNNTGLPDNPTVILDWLAKHSPPRIENGGIWIRLHVAGFTAIGFGDADGKTGAPRDVKVMIGDAIRNAAMRLGVGTYLWSKSERARAELSRQSQDDDERREVPASGRAERQRAGQAAQGEDPWAVKPLTPAGREVLSKAIAADDRETLLNLFTGARGLSPQHVTVDDLRPAGPLLQIAGPMLLPDVIERIGLHFKHKQVSVLQALEAAAKPAKAPGGPDDEQS